MTPGTTSQRGARARQIGDRPAHRRPAVVALAAGLSALAMLVAVAAIATAGDRRRSILHGGSRVPVLQPVRLPHPSVATEELPAHRVRQDLQGRPRRGSADASRARRVRRLARDALRARVAHGADRPLRLQLRGAVLPPRGRLGVQLVPLRAGAGHAPALRDRPAGAHLHRRPDARRPPLRPATGACVPGRPRHPAEDHSRDPRQEGSPGREPLLGARVPGAQPLRHQARTRRLPLRPPHRRLDQAAPAEPLLERAHARRPCADVLREDDAAVQRARRDAAHRADAGAAAGAPRLPGRGLPAASRRPHRLPGVRADALPVPRARLHGDRVVRRQRDGVLRRRAPHAREHGAHHRARRGARARVLRVVPAQARAAEPGPRGPPKRRAAQAKPPESRVIGRGRPRRWPRRGPRSCTPGPPPPPAAPGRAAPRW